MTRLQTEFHRLYRPHPAPADDTPPAGLIDDLGRVRALVLEVAAPADWDELAKVWRGVQADLGLPPPAIAASGTDGLQLWFSLSEPLAVAPAQAFLEALRRRYLPQLTARRVRLWPAQEAAGVRHAQPVPMQMEASGNWSAFVASDLAPLFADTPWLDVPPGDDGQAHLLSGLSSISPALLANALTLLTPVNVAEPAATARANRDDRDDRASAHRMDATGSPDPKAFLQAVMNDASVPLALRIEAAKALLPHTTAR